MFQEEMEYMECPSCQGVGSFTVGDIEDGFEEPCPECEGTGEVERYNEIFSPERDALTPND